MSARPSRERGAALVEFALIAPLFFVLLLGIVQVSVLYNRQQGLHAAAREGARLGSINGVTSTEVNDHIDDALEGISFDSTPSVAYVACGAGTDPTVVTVSITADTDTFVPFLTGTITQTGEGAFRCE